MGAIAAWGFGVFVAHWPWEINLFAMGLLTLVSCTAGLFVM
jgi:hypothetical protein